MSVSVCSVLLAASAAAPAYAAAADKTQALKSASYGYAALIDGRYKASIKLYTKAIKSGKLPARNLARALLNRAPIFGCQHLERRHEAPENVHAVHL